MHLQRDRVVSLQADLGGDDDIVEPQSLDGHLRQPFDIAGGAGAADGHVTDGDVAKYRRARGHGRFSGAHLAFHQVVVGHVDCLADVFHHPIVEAHVFHTSPAGPAALDAHSDLRAVAGNVAGHQVADPSRGLAAQGDRAVSVPHGAIGDGDVLAGTIDAQPIGIFAGFDHDAVVPGIDVAVGDAHVAAGIDGDTVGVHSRVGFDGHAAHGHVVRVQQVNGPHRGTGKVQPLDEDVPAVHGAHKRGPQLRRRFQIVFLRGGRFDFQ